MSPDQKVTVFFGLYFAVVLLVALEAARKMNRNLDAIIQKRLSR